MGGVGRRSPKTDEEIELQYVPPRGARTRAPVGGAPFAHALVALALVADCDPPAGRPTTRVSLVCKNCKIGRSKIGCGIRLSVGFQ